MVGIDLTGSERRASGWASLDGSEADVKLLASDLELVKETIRVKPHIVSIDSPLSIPFDPGNLSPSIMRTCERMLRRRGVNVYPCLIPSMRDLTSRGIRLAAQLRSQGLPVIESYPGAAQDILGIPRKRASLDRLKLGLSRFGFTGEWLTRVVSHDELDAITSALVGIFYWSGHFEALGSESEGYLIVPEIASASIAWRERLVVGFSGPIAAGKTTAALALKDERYAYERFSAVLSEILRGRGVAVTRDALQTLGNEIYLGGKQRWLCEQLIARLPKDRAVVIDGLRHPEDHACLTETFGPAFLHIHINAPLPLREERYKRHGYSAEDFAKALGHPSEANVERLEALADARVGNASSIPDLHTAVNRILSGLTARRRASTCL